MLCSYIQTKLVILIVPCYHLVITPITPIELYSLMYQLYQYCTNAVIYQLHNSTMLLNISCTNLQCSYKSVIPIYNAIIYQLYQSYNEVVAYVSLTILMY